MFNILTGKRCRVSNEMLTAWMQLFLTVLFTAGFFVVTFVVILGRAAIQPEMIRLADTLFGGMLAVLVQQSGYWFARQRNAVAQE